MADRYELWLRDPEAWRKALEANAVHGYGFTVIVAAGLWMLSLQDAIADGKQLEDVAEETFREGGVLNPALLRVGPKGDD